MHTTAMPNIAAVLKEEIARIARREIRDEVASLRKASAVYRSEIAELKRRNKELEQAVRRLQKSAGTLAQSEPQEPNASFRFSAKRLTALRRRLGLSAVDFGLLIDASDQSVHKWEEGNVHPRGKNLEAIAAIRSIGKREAAARIAELKGAA